MKKLLLKLFVLITIVNIVQSIQLERLKNVQFIYKGISKLAFINEKLIIECPINAQFYLWKFYQYQSEPQVLLEQEGKMLTIESVTADKSGIYECKSTTGFVNTDTNITVKIIDPLSDVVRETCSLTMSPKIRDLSKGLCFYNDKANKILDYKVGDKSEFDCTAVGNDLKYVWTFIDDSGRKTQLQMIFNISKIVMKSIVPENEGAYKCDVTDPYNNRISQTFKLSLTDTSPDMSMDIIGDKQEDLIALPGQKVYLKCEIKISFDRIHSVKWGKRIKNHESMSKSNVVTWDQYTYRLIPQNDIENSENHLISSVMLSQLESEHSGIYICLAMDNRGRTIHKMFNLTVTAGYTTTEPNSKNYYILLYILLPVILIIASVCIIIYCCVKSSSKKSHTSLPMKNCTNTKQNNINKESMTNYYYPVSNNRPPLPQPNESQASLVSPNTLTSYSSYGNYHMQSTNQPSCCSSNGV